MSDYITEDLQLQILKLLPVETLLRFRCVCKWWKQTIDSQPFIEDHLALQKRCLIVECEPAEYLVANPYELPPFDILIAPTPERLRLVGTLHGVVCFYNQIQDNFMLWNPSIRRCITVKGGPSLYWDFYDKGEHMVNPCCGFWIDPLTKDFKIIEFQLFDEEDDEDDECWVYSSIRGEWKELTFGYDLFHYTMEVAPAVVMEGVGYWIVYYDVDADNEEEKIVGVTVLSFDFVKESFLEPVYALGVKCGWNLPVLCDHNGALSLVYIDPNFSCDIFVRKEDKWVRADALLVFPIVKRCIWGMVDVEGKEKNYVMFLATATSDDLRKFDNSNPKAWASTWDLLRSKIKESNVVVANGFVESFIFPQTVFAQRLDVASQPSIGEGALASKTDMDQSKRFLEIEGVNKKRRLYEQPTNAYVNPAGSKSSESQLVDEEFARELEGIQERVLPQMNAYFDERMGKMMAEFERKLRSCSSQSLQAERLVQDGIQEQRRQLNAIKAQIPEMLAETARAKLARDRAELENAADKQRIKELVRAELAKIMPDLPQGDDSDDSTTT